MFAGVVSPNPVTLHDSGFFKKLVSKTKNGLGKVRRSLSPRKDKAVRDSEVEVRHLTSLLLIATAIFVYHAPVVYHDDLTDIYL